MLKWWKTLFESSPCFICGATGGDRLTREQKVDGVIHRRALCRRCHRDTFFYPWRYEGDWY